MIPDKIEFEIKNGPSGMDLMLAVHNRGQGKHPPQVKFHLSDKHTHVDCMINAYIHGAKLEDPFSLPEDYQIQGTVWYNDDWEYYRGEYNCSSRKGTLTIVLDYPNEEMEESELASEKAKYFFDITHRMRYILVEKTDLTQREKSNEVCNEYEIAKRINWAKTIEEVEQILKDWRK